MNATTEHLSLADLLSESRLACIEIGLSEIEIAACHDISKVHASEITEVTAKALRNHPEHAADILLISSWLFAEALCTEAQRDVVRRHYLTIAQSIENALS
jgi:hypothetical protein